MTLPSALQVRKSLRRAVRLFLKSLANRGYKVSKSKAQLCQILVKYLDLVLSEGTRALGKERIKPISSSPLPQTFKQLRGFLGITGFCRLWIPGYGEIAHPLHQIIKETKATKTHSAIWEPEARLIFDQLKQAWLKVPTLSLPIGKMFNLCMSENK